MPFPAPTFPAREVTFRVGNEVFAIRIVALAGARWEAITTTITDTDEQWITVLVESVTEWTCHSVDDTAVEWESGFTVDDARTLWNAFPQFVRVEVASQLQDLNLGGGDEGKALSTMNAAVEKLIGVLSSSPPPRTGTGSR